MILLLKNGRLECQSGTKHLLDDRFYFRCIVTRQGLVKGWVTATTPRVFLTGDVFINYNLL